MFQHFFPGKVNVFPFSISKRIWLLWTSNSHLPRLQKSEKSRAKLMLLKETVTLHLQCKLSSRILPLSKFHLSNPVLCQCFKKKIAKQLSLNDPMDDPIMFVISGLWVLGLTLGCRNAYGNIGAVWRSIEPIETGFEPRYSEAIAAIRGY